MCLISKNREANEPFKNCMTFKFETNVFFKLGRGDACKNMILSYHLLLSHQFYSHSVTTTSVAVTIADPASSNVVWLVFSFSFVLLRFSYVRYVLFILFHHLFFAVERWKNTATERISFTDQWRLPSHTNRIAVRKRVGTASLFMQKFII